MAQPPGTSSVCVCVWVGGWVGGCAHACAPLNRRHLFAHPCSVSTMPSNSWFQALSLSNHCCLSQLPAAALTPESQPNHTAPCTVAFWLVIPRNLVLPSAIRPCCHQGHPAPPPRSPGSPCPLALLDPSPRLFSSPSTAPAHLNCFRANASQETTACSLPELGPQSVHTSQRHRASIRRR